MEVLLVRKASSGGVLGNDIRLCFLPIESCEVVTCVGNTVNMGISACV